MIEDSESPNSLDMRCRFCVGCFRRIGFIKAVVVVFVTILLLYFTVQLHQLPLSSAKVINKKASVPHSRQVLPRTNTSLEKQSIAAGVDSSRVIGKGRSPKQVNEDIKSPSVSKGNDPTYLNHTTKGPVTSAYVDPLPSLSGPTSLEMLQEVMLRTNQAQTIYNQDKFPALGEDGLVLIVQAHKRDGYLKQLLESLKVTRGIEKILLVISHDYYYDDMNKLIRSIDFCPVMQIFYPFSFQVLPTSFPGASPNDCPRDANKAKAVSMDCANAQHPDTYGHYREAVVTAIKHHWWWKSNMVFDGLRVTQNYSGYVLFLEEDHYVAPDFLQVARQLMTIKETQCTDCDFINLGMYNKAKTLSNRASAGVWNAGKNNMGFGMNRHTWNLIRNCSKHFCTYDDYNWDWSLNQLGKACSLFQRDLKVLVMRTPRVFHIGTCGTHHHRSCNEAQQANTVRDFLTKQSSNLFPDHLILDRGLYPSATRKKIKPYGGWGDIRDHEFCMKFTEKEALLDGKLPVS